MPLTDRVSRENGSIQLAIDAYLRRKVAELSPKELKYERKCLCLIARLSAGGLTNYQSRRLCLIDNRLWRRKAWNQG